MDMYSQCTLFLHNDLPKTVKIVPRVRHGTYLLRTNLFFQNQYHDLATRWQHFINISFYFTCMKLFVVCECRILSVDKILLRSHWYKAVFHTYADTGLINCLLPPLRSQTIIRTNVGILLIGPLETDFDDIWTKYENIHICFHVSDIMISGC